MSQTNQIDVLQKQREILQQEIQNTNKLFLDVKNKPTTLLQRIQLINKQNQCPQRIDRRAEGRDFYT